MRISEVLIRMTKRSSSHTLGKIYENLELLTREWKTLFMKYMKCSEHGLYIPSKSIEKKDNGYGRWISESSARDNHRYCNDKKF